MISLPVWLPGPMFLPRGLCPGGSLSKEVSIQKCLYPEVSLSMGVSVQGVFVHGGFCGETPQSEKQVVHILLECFLVFILFPCRMYFYEHDNANSFNTTHF